ncbi:amidohydrolase family protein [candidate division KSB1 bacterium]
MKVKKFSINRRIRTVLLIMFILIFSHVSPAQNSLNSFAIKNVRIFNGEDIIENGNIIVLNGKISSVGKHITFPSGINIIDGSDKTLLPGFIDSHVHLWDKSALSQSLIFGVTTVIDMFMSINIKETLDAVFSSSDRNELASFYTSGILATAPGGHGTQYGMDIPTINDAKNALKFVDARIAEGSHFIKIIMDDFSTYGSKIPTLNKEIVSALSAAAKLRGKLTVIHIATLEDAITAIEAGVDGLAHLFSNADYNPDFGKIAAENKVFVIPTFTVLETICGISGSIKLVDDPDLLPYLKPFDITNFKRTFPSTANKAGYESAEKALRQLIDENVTILAGTDAPNPGTSYGVSLHRELELLVKAGMTPVEALKAATANPAGEFGLKDRGFLKEGLIADIVLVNGNPAENILETRDIMAVWKNGKKINRKDYLLAVKDENEEVERQKKGLLPKGAESGLISDFEEEKIVSKFGAGWIVSTDIYIGGKSKAEMKRIETGADGSSGAMEISGTIVEGAATPWAGVLFSPGSTMMAPTNFSSKKAITFWAKGNQKEYTVMVFAQSLGYEPSILTFEASHDWKKYEFDFEKFGTDAKDLMGIYFGGGSIGNFKLNIDNVKIE